MAGWSSPAYQSLHNLRVSGVRSKDSSAYMDQLRSIFNQMLGSSLKDVPSHEPRPLPVFLGDGRSVDLFKMYFTVRDRGSYDSISGNGSWASIAQELGFDSQFAAPLKLVYAKYLSGMDRCFGRWAGEICTAGGDNCEPETVGLKPVDLELGEEKISVDLTDGEYVLKQCDMGKDGGSVIYVTSDGSEENASCGMSISSEGGSFGKRKRESLVGLLNWLKVIAMNPCDPEKGRMVGTLAAEDYRVDECWARVLAAREALFHWKDSFTRSDPYMQKKHRVHPSFYDDLDGTSQQAAERVRSSERLIFLNSRPPRTCSISTPVAKSQPVKPSHARASGSIEGPSCKVQFPRLSIPIGSDFQACVPEWVGVTCECPASDASEDSKWLGTQSWPSSGACTSPVIDDQIGKGRPSSCTCQLPGSVGCVKRHISEARLSLRYQLGSAFYGWRFDEMGDEVSVSWSLYDEQMFKTLVRLNHPSEGKDFWNEAYTHFPTKSRGSLVSYYFNVFILRRRSFQNRVTPHNIDSDNDEYDFGPVYDDLVAQRPSGDRDMQCGP